MSEILNFFAKFWQSYLVHLIDIAIIYYVFYKIILLIKGTRTEQVTRGLVILLLATFVARLLRLSATGWILQRFWLAGIVALVIVFQPELRNLLAQLGRGRISKFFFSKRKLKDPSWGISWRLISIFAKYLMREAKPK